MKSFLHRVKAGPILVLFASVVLGCGSDDRDTQPSLDDHDMGMVDAAGGDADVVTDMEGTDDPHDFLFEPGPFEVGFVEFDVAYTPPGAQEARVLPVKAWYPAAEDSGASPVEYSVSGIVSIDGGTALEAPPAATGDFPVAFYSHGFGGEGLLAYPYGESFASWGWVVVAPNHVGNTALDAISGNLLPFAQVVLERVLDVSAVLDAVEAAATETALDEVSDTDRVFAFGHSFGGYTVLAAAGADYGFDGLVASCAGSDDASCEYLENADVEAAFADGFGDERILAIAPQAPALVPGFEDGAIAGLGVPVMLQSGDLDATTTLEAQARPAWEAVNGDDDIWIRGDEAAHFTFISICYDLSAQVLMSLRPDAFDDGCGEGFVDAREALPVFNAYLLDFAREHVSGEGASGFQQAEAREGFSVTRP